MAFFFFFKRSIEYSLSIDKHYHTPPVVLAICIHNTSSDLMKSTTASDALPFLLELPCHGWAQAYYLMNAGFIASHLQDNPLNPIIAVVYFLIQPKPSLLDMDKQGDETIIMLYELAKKIFEIAKTKFGSMELFLQPEVALACFPVSVVFGWFYYHVTILPPTFAGTYHFSTGPTDLCCLADDIGNTTGLLFSGLISDRLYARAIKKNGGVAVKGFCLRPIYIGIPFFVAGSIMYGWFLHAHVHWMGSFVRYTMTFILVDSNHTKAASVLSVSNATKNICVMIFALTTVFIRNSLGVNWSYTLAGIMLFIFDFTKIWSQWREREKKKRESKT